MCAESPRGEIGEFIARIRAGDEEAATELLRRYEAKVRLVVRRQLPRLLRSKFDSLDFLQSVWGSFFHRVRTGPTDIEDEPNLVAFLAWIAGLVRVGSAGSVQMAVVQGTYIFDVILVVVLGGISLVGGRGGVFSVVVGCALIGTLLNAFTIMDVNSEVQNIIRGVVLLAAIVIDNWLHPRDEETARQGD